MKKRNSTYSLCSKCNDSISNFAFKRHFETCNGVFKNLRKKKISNFKLEDISVKINDKFECLKCHKQYSQKGIKIHYWRNHSKEGKKFNPNHGYKKRIRITWNKGLTKETNLSVLKSSKTLKARYKSGELIGSFKGKHHTIKTRKKLSKIKIELYKNFPEKHPNRKLAGNRNKMTYPEKVAFDWLTKNKINFENQKKILNYYVDFLIDKNIVIEIDGEYWHKDKVRDLTRENKISKLGYKIFRIKAKEKIENKLQEILQRNINGSGSPTCFGSKTMNKIMS